ncbi:MAG: MucB/RseB C-terminal domain-containing protein [Sideroxydans sp.]|nr:MucB/RseB C-terminal domain-containing protein [Sideroxydans sp.]
MQLAMRQTGYLILVMFQLGAVSAFADAASVDESDKLKTIAFAAHQNDYSGVYVHQSGGRVGMSRITHVSEKDGEHERREELDGAKREIIRSNGQVWLFADGHHVKMEMRRIRPAFPALLPEQIATLKENYAVTREEDDEVAGYHAQTFIFQPRDNLRYSRKMWADSTTGLLLKAVVLDDRGYVIEQYAFMELNINGNIDHSWIVREKAPAEESARQLHPAPLPKAESLAEHCDWQVDALPAGFKKILEMRRPFRENKEPVIHLVFSDGLAGISVFIEKTNGTTNLHYGLVGQGEVNIYSRIVGDSLVTVVGEVPAKTVIQIADSVRYAGQ